MSAYYNENDPYAAQWLRNLITAGHIAPGPVDERSIEDVIPAELSQFTQCHFFAGIGIWSLALRQAGWPDNRRVWTGSCPCQPFSSAGQSAGFDDERHLWPAWHHLIGEQQPPIVFGEQVTSQDGLAWLDLVQVDMEGTGYALGPLDHCAAGYGSPNIRQRLYFAAERLGDTKGRGRGECGDETLEGSGGHIDSASGASGGMANGECSGSQGQPGHGDHGDEPGWLDPGQDRPVAAQGDAGWVAGAVGQGCNGGPGLRGGEPAGNGGIQSADDGGFHRMAQDRGRMDIPGPVNGMWEGADWLLCRDGRCRPVEPDTFPLAHGAASRVGRLRAYGNGINLAQATGFIRAYMDARP